MRPLTTTAALAAAAMSLLASPGATRHPIAVTRSALAAVSGARPGSGEPACHEPTDGHSSAAREHTVSDISWFQGTLEEAFTRHAHKDHRPLLHF
jgi:hypothetical protein